ncbi:hypothetical protein HS088_TW03G01015 [Tripterygium wilfordii]|uniref:Uncharacterized protein n=1 Tax=Tripterygium wilfordii TaxID=458696 RepID=A0A7J7DX50_TRIWF|nr:uncharacterized protein LOC119995327 [Tripterygium wilfordii]KAF5750676.1 hypothetical protein HS088_TW03G01015 [Tripterygium wilfordii]
MFSTSRALHPPQNFSMKSSSMKIKTLIHTLVVSHMCRIVRVLAKAKAIIIDIMKETQLTKTSTGKYKRRNIVLGSFRLHYNWCSNSHVLPVPAPVLDAATESSWDYDSSWKSIISSEQCGDGAELSVYLQWLEEKVDDEEEKKNEINRLADLFIANCHEKFLLEKQESHRRFQEMLARSL